MVMALMSGIHRYPLTKGHWNPNELSKKYSSCRRFQKPWWSCSCLSSNECHSFRPFCLGLNVLNLIDGLETHRCVSKNGLALLRKVHCTCHSPDLSMHIVYRIWQPIKAHKAHGSGLCAYMFIYYIYKKMPNVLFVSIVQSVRICIFM